jgi:hypothetical protein
LRVRSWPTKPDAPVMRMCMLWILVGMVWMGG